jgi:uncharacterized protein YdaU (DUF1376 family)
MGDMPFIKFYPSDFLAGTSGLSPSERGVYITLLCLIYEVDGEIIRDDARLSRRCGTPKASFVRTINALICDGKLTERDGMLSNKRAEKMIADRQIRTQNATHAANQKWIAHREKIQTNQSDNDASALQRQCVDDASQNPEPDIKTEAKASVKKPRRSPLVDLPDAWVPNDTNIADAEKRGFSQQEINDEADRFGNYHRSKQSQFRDWNAAWRTWLSNARKFGKGGGMARQAESRGYEQGGSIASIVARRRAEGKV